jgi:hypothetical protein
MASPEVELLKKQLSITPKTATLLIKAGYADYRNLANVSPEFVAKQFSDDLRVPIMHAKAYKRPLRRIVWLGTQKSPEKYPKDCKNWSNKALEARGIWCSTFDQLTGKEIEAKLKEASSMKSAKSAKPKVEKVKTEKIKAEPKAEPT